MNFRTIWKGIIIINTFFIISCSKENTDPPTSSGSNGQPSMISSEISIITGLILHDDIGIQIGVLGNPNTKLPINIQPYPNTPGSFIHIYNADTISKVWVLPAVVNKQFSQIDYNQLFQNFDYSIEEIEKTDIIRLEPQINNPLLIDLSSLTSGYYRIFLQTNNGSLYWDNIFVNTDLTYQEKIDSLVIFWQ